MKTFLSLLCVGSALTLLPGCNRGPRPEFDESAGYDHVNQSPHLPPQRVSHGMTKLDRYVQFPFEVPAHVVSPQLKGEFTSFIQGTGGARIADETADVELMVMNEEQYDAFVKKRGAESVYAIEPSHDHGVEIILPTTRDTAVRYYAVFRRTTDGKAPIWVKSELTIEFGSSQSGQSVRLPPAQA